MFSVLSEGSVFVSLGLWAKVHYLNSHLDKFRKEPDVKIKLEDLRGLAHYSNISPEDKKNYQDFY